MASSRVRVWLILALLAGLTAACASLPMTLDPALAAAARRGEPLSVSDALEALIAAGQDTKADREFAYRAVKDDYQDTAAATFARAAVTGRLIQLQGLRAAHLLQQVESDALRSRALGPTFRDGAATRLLGTLYIAAPASFLAYGDSERGLELLEGLAADRPDLLVNQLRLAEAYLALDDPGPANALLCRCSARRDSLRPDERVLLDRLIEQNGPLACLDRSRELGVAAPSH